MGTLWVVAGLLRVVVGGLITRRGSGILVSDLDVREYCDANITKCSNWYGMQVSCC